MSWPPVLLAIAACLVLGLFLIAESLRARGVSAETTRQVVHAGAGTLGATLPFYLTLVDVALLCLASVVMLGWTAHLNRLLSVHGVARRTLGAVLFPVGGFLAAIIAWGHPAALAYGLLVLAWADSAAALAGRSMPLGRWHVPGGNKTVAGSVSFALVTAALGLAMSAWHHPADPVGAVVAACIAAALLAGVEGCLGYGLDNACVPVLAALIGQYYLFL